ncbi:MAG: hypothetical protein QOJ84_809 [Bradyrhizobium sp.]|nr:hypothetical protein [Bradyrhizobium sp.]
MRPLIQMSWNTPVRIPCQALRSARDWLAITLVDLIRHFNRIQLSQGLASQNGRTIPTRGISVTIQPKTTLRRSSTATGAICEAGSVFTACRISNMQTAQFEIHRE